MSSRERKDSEIMGNDRIFRLFAALTDYPSDAEKTAEYCRELEAEGMNLGSFGKTAANSPVDVLQEHFTDVFDFSSETAPYAAYHIFPEDRRRAGFMSFLAGLYIESGFERNSSELPDYIPLILSFLGENGAVYAGRILPELAEAVGKISESTLKSGSYYHSVYQALKDFADECIKGGVYDPEFSV
jgi:nitrate reductase delta subunit